ncbi:hypothetical protein [Roseimicrobium sp. ORNL1]|uniref:hypothetical protein n=1 Tax=Roseimicrobium sp. ORNL1 TaxID=2711231 RepID=UPI0013E12342|nr:hypothetical protein [Roseimicrobium sp. ORNL1]QIF03928.1 hypothetical protein G5S37_21145 [Roseimicrobium sp. ORNL1]
MKRWLTTIIVAGVVVFNPVTIFVAWIGTAQWSNNHPETGTNLSAVDWLPASASDISYWKTYSWSAWEFTMKEEEFRKWASRYELREISGAQSIERFSWIQFWRSHRDYDGDAWEEEEREKRKHVATVRNGLFATERRKDGGGYKLVFDRETNRVYHQSNPR